MGLFPRAGPGAGLTWSADNFQLKVSIMHPAVLTLDHAGLPSHWATWEATVVAKVKGLIAWHAGSEFEVLGGRSRATGLRTMITVPTIVSLKGQRFNGRVPLTNHALFQRDAYICCYCGQQFSRSRLTREHIIPVSRGGKNTWLNCATCCEACNQAKKNLLPEEAGMRLVYVPYEPNVAESLLLSGRNIISDQMEFLTRHVKHAVRPLG